MLSGIVLFRLSRTPSRRLNSTANLRSIDRRNHGLQRRQRKSRSFEGRTYFGERATDRTL